MMYSDVPNMASAFGYTNASWTLKCDLTCEYVCRLINYMDRQGYKQCVPHNLDPSVSEMPPLDFSSGYVQRSIAINAQTRLEAAVAAVPELCPRHRDPALRQDR